MITNEIRDAIGRAGYIGDMMNYLRGKSDVVLSINQGKMPDGSSVLPAATAKRYEKEFNRFCTFNSLATTFKRYDGPDTLWACDSDDEADFLASGASIDVTNIKDDFTRTGIKSHKAVSFLKASRELIQDADFDIEGYIVKRFGKSFGKAEDKAFLTGNGVKEPVGILDATYGAQTGVSTATITYSNIVSLFFSVDPQYRTSGTWMVNDTTATFLRTLQDNKGNLIWKDGTILGRPVVINNYMPDIETGKKPILFGDFSYYWIIRRSPVCVKVLTELFSITDQIGYVAHEYLDGRLIRTDAVKTILITE